MTLTSFEFVVSGTVHGVGFRYFVRELARRDGIVGWVKNDLVSGQQMILPCPPVTNNIPIER